MQIGDITPRLLALDGPVPAFRRVAQLVSGINVSRVLARGFKSALLISKVGYLYGLGRGETRIVGCGVGQN
jgi:hypothetical protein